VRHLAAFEMNFYLANFNFGRLPHRRRHQPKPRFTFAEWLSRKHRMIPNCSRHSEHAPVVPLALFWRIAIVSHGSTDLLRGGKRRPLQRSPFPFLVHTATAMRSR